MERYGGRNSGCAEGNCVENRMAKKLSEMTLEELWQLFPIFLVEHDERWNIWYHEECQRIQDFLAGNIIDVKISHIGSTAIEIFGQNRSLIFWWRFLCRQIFSK